MKKILILLIAMALGGLTSSQALADTFLKNNYGASLYYVKLPQSIVKSPKVTLKPDALKLLGNGEQVELKDFSFLTIQTIYEGPLSSYDASHLVQQAKNEQDSHPQEDAIITVHGSWNPLKALSWDVKLTWEPKK